MLSDNKIKQLNARPKSHGAFMVLMVIMFCAFTMPGIAIADAITPEIGQEHIGHLHSFDGPVEVLSAEDQILYREVFALQNDGNWPKADKLIARIENDILMGHVKYQRYMHPTKYRSRYTELSAWLNDYADHPGANRLYQLAKKRQGRARAPSRPVPVVLSANSEQAGNDDIIPTPRPRPEYVAPIHSASEQKEINRVLSRVRREIRRGKPEQAEKRLWAFARRDMMTDAEFDDALTDVASSYFFSGNDEKAYALASLASERSRAIMSQPDWIAGLTAFRAADYAHAAEHFDHVSKAEVSGESMQAAGGFWAARSHLRAGNPAAVEPLLHHTASLGLTFYSQLAARQIGHTYDFSWHADDMQDEDLFGLMSLPAVRRVVALAEVGLDDLADEELRLVWTRKQFANRQAIVAMAAKLNLPATQVLLAQAAPESEALPLSAYYPVPDWEPEGGFKVDRALFFAIMRQESHFRPKARSRVGAMGLMQLMPATASWVARDRSLRWSNKRRLLEPELNMSLSQTYMLQLLSQDMNGEDMFRFATAYNGGPGNLSRWEKKMNYGDDPLMFIETIPARETRNYIEKIFANMWIYRARMGQPQPSLDAIASGGWPVLELIDDLYPPQLGFANKEERHAQN